jgi:hypothetical protein
MLSSRIELEKYAGVEIPMGDWDIVGVYDNIIMCEYVDLDDSFGDGLYIVRDGISIPLDTVRTSWRIVKALHIGPEAKGVEVGDLLMVPGDRGIPCIQRTENGKKKYFVFINMDRIFCKVKPKDKTQKT